MKLLDADAIVRSKDAGPCRFTLDVIFNNKEQFVQMKASGVWNKKNLSALCHIDPDTICECLVYDPALAFKCTYQRPISSGAFGDNDIYGSHQHVSLYGLEF